MRTVALCSGGKSFDRHFSKLAEGRDKLVACRVVFAVSVSIFLLLTASAKLIAIIQNRPFLDLADPVVASVRMRHSLVTAAGLEILVAGFVLWRRKYLSAMVAISWLMAVFVSYRMLMKAFFASEPCKCLGGVLDWSGIPSGILRVIPVVLLWYMGIGSFIFLFMAAFFYRDQSALKSKVSQVAMRMSLCFFLILFSAVQGHAEGGIRVSGRFTRLTFNGRGKPTPTLCSTNDFHIVVTQDGRYAIQVDSLEETDSVYLTYDGDDSYFVRYRSVIIGRAKGRPAVVAVKPITEQASKSYVSDGSYPFAPDDELKRAHMLWLVYGSGNYIRSLKTNTMPLPWMSARLDMAAYGFRLEHELSVAPPYFPRHLRFIRDSRLDLSENEEVTRLEVDGGGADWTAHLAGDLRDRNTEYKNGFVRGEMEVDQFTNYNGMEIPLSFSIKGYDPMLKGLSWQATGRVTIVVDLAASENSKELFLPPVLGPLSVRDSRFRYQDDSRKVDAIHYGLRLGEKWMPKDSLRLQSLYTHVLKSLPLSARPLPTNLRNTRIAMTVVFLLGSLTFTLILYRIFRKNRMRQ